MLITDQGQTIRVPVAGIRIQGRAAQGVTVFRVDEGERVVSVERIAEVRRRERAHETHDGNNKRVGLYPGTFDPVTLGHLDIIKRAVKLVDHLVIGVATNASKNADVHSRGTHGDAASAKPRRWRQGRAHDRRCRPSTRCWSISPRQVGASVIMRGLRAVSDFEYEFQMVAMNQRLNPEIETVFLMADPRHQAIASRLVKEIAMLGGDIAPFTTPRCGRGCWSNDCAERKGNVMARDPENTLDPGTEDRAGGDCAAGPIWRPAMWRASRN